MKTYSEKFWSEIDRPSRETVTAFFSKYGQVEGSTGNCWYDLVWTYKDRKIAIEIKDRAFAHDRYGDIMCEEIKKECKIRNLHAVFITEFLTAEDLYKLRKATDMFVHVQTTDAFSGSVQEYILCNKKIVHGSWIKYETLESFSPLFYFPVDNLENLGKVIVKAYYSDNIKIPQGVIDYVKKSGWDNKATLMNDFYMSIVYNLDS